MASRLLLDEQVIALYPSLVRALGGHDLAAFVQQVHFRSQLGPEQDGHQWAVQSTAEWCDDVVLTLRQFKRIVTTLTDLGVLVRSSAAGSIDRTAWSRIDYDRLDELARTDALGRNRANGQAETVPMTSARNRADELLPKKQEELGNTQAEADAAHAAQPGGSPLPSESVACPEGKQAGGCGAPAGAPCSEGGRSKRYRGRSHTIRVAHVLAVNWWEGVKERTGHRPAMEFAAVRLIIRKMLDADWSHDAVGQAVESLHRDGRTITAQTLEARLRGRFPGERLAVVTQMQRSLDRGRNGSAPPLPEFGSRPIFDLSKPIPEAGAARALNR